MGKRGQNKMHHLHLAWREHLAEEELRHLDEMARERARRALKDGAAAELPAMQKPKPPIRWVAMEGRTPMTYGRTAV